MDGSATYAQSIASQSAPTPSAHQPASVSDAAAKPAYPPPASIPTQAGPKGLRFDFNEGCRVMLPEAEHPWRVRLSDLDTGNILYETDLRAGRVASTKRYYVRFGIDVWQQGEPVFRHEYSAQGKDILTQFPVGTLGDTLGWFPMR